jgi:hypothetical protein
MQPLHRIWLSSVGELGMSAALRVTDTKPSGVLPLPTRSVQKPGRRKVSHWIRFQLWLNTYR